MRKKMISIMLVFAMCMPLCIPAFATGRDEGPKSTSMMIEEFDARYVGDNPLTARVAFSMDTNDTSSPSIDYNNIAYDPSNREISFNATINKDGELTSFAAEGILYSSYKADYGINSVVGDLRDTTEQYEILRFEIYNDNDLSMLYAINTPKTATTPTLVLYLRAGDELYLFETAIPSEMSTITLPNTPDCKTTEGALDGFWFESIVAPVMSEDSASPVMPLDDTDTIVEPVISASWTISGVVYRYCAKPSIYYRFANVNDSTSTWIARFGIDEAYAYVDGTKSTLTGLRLTNIDLSFVTGPYTLMLRGYSEFNLYDSYVLLDPSSISGYIGIAAGATGSIGAQIATQVLSDLLEAGYSSKKITSGKWTLLTTGNKDSEGRGFRYYVPNRYFMQNTDQFLEYQLDVTASNFGLSNATSGSRTGKIKISFDYYTGDGTTKYSKTYDVTGSYYCTVTRP